VRCAAFPLVFSSEHRQLGGLEPRPPAPGQPSRGPPPYHRPWPRPNFTPAPVTAAHGQRLLGGAAPRSRAGDRVDNRVCPPCWLARQPGRSDARHRRRRCKVVSLS